MSDENLPTVVEAEVMLAPADERSVEDSIDAYLKLQQIFDEKLEGCQVTIQGKLYRTRAYWRALATAFNLRVECIHDERMEMPDGDWGFTATYRASKGERCAEGDGACMASEKSERQATVHNVRSHAHTRAYNRAVSNLVGFGEVSSDEIQRDVDDDFEGGQAPAPRKSRPAARSGVRRAAEEPPPASSAEGPLWIDEPIGFTRNHGKQSWRYIMEHHVDLLEWLISDKFKPSSPTGEKAKQRAGYCLDMLNAEAS